MKTTSQLTMGPLSTKMEIITDVRVDSFGDLLRMGRIIFCVWIDK